MAGERVRWRRGERHVSDTEALENLERHYYNYLLISVRPRMQLFHPIFNRDNCSIGSRNIADTIVWQSRRSPEENGGHSQKVSLSLIKLV